jgi:hypothetical protein
VLCNGSLHFIGHDDGVIMAFNVTDETFGTLMPPQGMDERKDDYSLTELGTSVCAFTPHGNATQSQSVRRDYEAGCWEKLACVRLGELARSRTRVARV